MIPDLHFRRHLSAEAQTPSYIPRAISRQPSITHSHRFVSQPVSRQQSHRTSSQLEPVHRQQSFQASLVHRPISRQQSFYSGLATPITQLTYIPTAAARHYQGYHGYHNSQSLQPSPYYTYYNYGNQVESLSSRGS